jgi:hypothetical protein
MKENKMTLVLHHALVLLLAAYGMFATVQLRRLGERVDAVEQRVAQVLDPRLEVIASSR